ncbi:hypothetical protein CEXT_800481 [Caerostris extrusa]|uniref:Secreted protein n=1 Tax=Caerostris extrusa TaxID=172846 RepID=A0AAV4MEI7_CAEEX|nr:hypothetical protein CEXT_800481 [Caerostris extrusa]
MLHYACVVCLATAVVTGIVTTVGTNEARRSPKGRRPKANAKGPYLEPFFYLDTDRLLRIFHLYEGHNHNRLEVHNSQFFVG